MLQVYRERAYAKGGDACKARWAVGSGDSARIELFTLNQMGGE